MKIKGEETHTCEYETLFVELRNNELKLPRLLPIAVPSL